MGYSKKSLPPPSLMRESYHFDNYLDFKISVNIFGDYKYDLSI
jgi:hypothetical protein